MGIIESSYENIETAQILPSFFKWLLSGALNDGSGGLFGIGLLLVIALSGFLIFNKFGYERAIITSSTITWIVALLSLKAGWINVSIFTLACIYVVIALYYLFKESSGREA